MTTIVIGKTAIQLVAITDSDCAVLAALDMYCQCLVPTYPYEAAVLRVNQECINSFAHMSECRVKDMLMGILMSNKHRLIVVAQGYLQLTSHALYVKAVHRMNNNFNPQDALFLAACSLI